ncbi:MAG: tripartite tricarboxylate transporter substrate binding protein [Pusillimonas sp.]
MNRRQALKSLSAIGVGMAGLPSAFAQPKPYPAAPVRVMVGTAPGGITDYLARLFAQHISEGMKQSFVVENRGGASGTLAAAAVARAAPDGYTLLATTPTVTIVAPHLYSNLSFEPDKDLAPVCLLGAGPMVLVVNAELPIHSAADLIAWAKSKPGEIAYASGGMGTAAHLTGELFATSAGLKLVHVPYKGDGQGAIDVLGGQVPMMFSVMSVLGPHIKSGKLRALGVASQTRMPSYPDIPTLAEAGVSDVDSLAWVGIYAPAGTPQEIITQLNQHWQTARQLPRVAESISSVAMDQITFSTPQGLAEFQQSEKARWDRVIKASGVQPS